jgi:hypothetical protein
MDAGRLRASSVAAGSLDQTGMDRFDPANVAPCGDTLNDSNGAFVLHVHSANSLK